MVNLLHLVSESEAKVIIDGISKSLMPGGRCVIYGPFMRDGFLTSDGDKCFHQSLVEADLDIGYKDDSSCLGCSPNPGDLNNDTFLDVMDVILIVDCILSNSCNECSDFNEDGTTNVFDVINVVDIILNL